jgi:hypothetical protein
MMLGEREEPHIRSTPIQKSETCSDGRRPILIEIEHMPGISEYKSILMMMMMMMAASENNQIFFPPVFLLLLFHFTFQLKKEDGAIDDFFTFL